eukprot:TRINITY_DN10513_c0_g1_i1.p1 TRINITY_DN10513_c0_g1~~TRINITY_DN10513_c0_g1_i1.p1  ORF type:complete len:572 (+),score=91.47 TRINITY_DN10513_c0_g1_i1:52-1716(+)
MDDAEREMKEGYDSDLEQTASVITSDRDSFCSDRDAADKVADGHDNPDGPDHSWIEALWSDPNEIVTEEDAEARFLFRASEENDGECFQLADLDELEVRSYRSDDTDDQAEKGSSKKQLSLKTDTATSQTIEVIKNLVSLIEENGGWSKAILTWIDFESAVQHSPVKCAPCEVGCHYSTLAMNELPTVSESELLKKYYDCKYPEGGTSPNPWLANDLERQIQERGIPINPPCCYYHRILVPGPVPKKLKATSYISRNTIHGIPESGINGAARSSVEIFDVLKSIEECLYPAPSKHACFRYANDENILRKVPTPSPTRGSLLFGFGVPLERAALTSLASYARDEYGRGPYRWSAPLYDAIHLIQAMSYSSSGQLLSQRAVTGISLFMKATTLKGDEHEICTSPCKYHTFIEQRSATLGYHVDWHCALTDATLAAVQARYIARRFFPKLLVEYRTNTEIGWLDIPLRKKLVLSTSPEFQQALADFTYVFQNMPTAPWDLTQWDTVIVPQIFQAIETQISQNNQDLAGKLINAWHLLGSSDYVIRPERDNQDDEMTG